MVRVSKFRQGNRFLINFKGKKKIEKTIKADWKKFLIQKLKKGIFHAWIRIKFWIMEN